MIKVRGKFLPFDEWLYYKIYCNASSSESIMSHLYKESFQKLKNKNLIDQFFFMRFEDPNYHIRLRVRGVEGNTHIINQEVLTGLDSFISDRVIFHISLVPYERELTRYKAQNIESIEKIFFYDSISIIKGLDFISSINFDRWILAVFLVNSYLEVFNLDTRARYKMMEHLSKEWFNELNLAKSTKIDIDLKYRTQKKFIEEVLENSNNSVPINKLKNILYKEHQERNNFVNSILVNRENSSEVISELLSSLIHMSMNRLFQIDPNKCELLIYTYMSKYYKSLMFTDNYR